MTDNPTPARRSASGSRARARTERPPRCERPKLENGRPCKRAAGGGTDHPGFGPCSLHDDGSWAMPPFAENLEARAAFLAGVRADKTAGIRELVEPLGYKRRDVTLLVDADPDFEADYVEARGYDHDSIRNELRKRAFDGGSDRLLEFEAKMRLPEAQELLKHRVDGRLEVAAVPYLDLSKLTPERARLLVELLREATPTAEQLPPDGRPALELVMGGDGER